MKYRMMITALIFSFAAFSTSAQTPAAPAANANHPCKQIAAACEAAGYVKNAHKTTGKGLIIDCMKPIMEGKTVPGVSVTPSEVSSCQAKEAAYKAKTDK